MKSLSAENRNRYWYRGLLVMLLCVAGLSASSAMAQQATANVTGVVKDQSGAAIPNAQVELISVSTAVVRKTTTNTDGIYNFPSVVPGSYSMQVSASGFSAVSQPPVTLQVGQTATFDFHLNVGVKDGRLWVHLSDQGEDGAEWEGDNREMPLPGADQLR